MCKVSLNLLSKIQSYAWGDAWLAQAVWVKQNIQYNGKKSQNYFVFLLQDESAIQSVDQKENEGSSSNDGRIEDDGNIPEKVIE